MIRLSTTWRLTLGMVCLSVSVYLGARWVGLVPSRVDALVDGRRELCEAIAIDVSLVLSENLAQPEKLDSIRSRLKAIVHRNPQLQSAALRSSSGHFLVEVGEHRAYWAAKSGDESTPTHMVVPLHADRAARSQLELCFTEPVALGPLGLFAAAELRLVAFLAAVGALAYYLYLRKILSYLNPTDVIPQRVRNTLDTLADGLLVLDSQERIILANEAFAQTIGMSAARLQGRNINDLPWECDLTTGETNDDGGVEFPWTLAIRSSSRQTGAVVRLASGKTGSQTFKVNTSPILGGDGVCRGALASFDDVTLLQERTAKLGDTLKGLQRSRDQIRRQNEQLATLATLDPLTGCLNRRALFDRFEKLAQTSRENDQPLACLILDLDDFKKINDTHGHRAGDDVLKVVAAVLKKETREDALVGRYGGEEFCIVAPNTDLQAAGKMADRLRKAIEQAKSRGLSVTASFGATSTSLGTYDQQELLEQADQAMYVAKRSGRNRVMRWDQIGDEPQFSPMSAETTETAPAETPIPFHAVTVLLSMLNYRHTETAEHSRRVADLCVAAAAGLLPEGDRYVLEVAALLHDIGKLGIPDTILLKPDRLTDAELRIVRTHVRIGAEILAAAFDSAKLTDTVRNQHTWFAPNDQKSNAPRGTEIPLAARILFIAEAFDAMVVDQVYRKAMSYEEAFRELRRFAGTQFDPELVERFIATVESSRVDRSDSQSNSARQVALRIGLQIEKLMCAVEAEDRASLFSMAGRLKVAAEDHSLEEIVRQASELESRAAVDSDWDDIVRLGADLLELCRTVQAELLDEAELNAV